MDEKLSRFKHYYYLYLFFPIKYFSFKKLFNMLLSLHEFKKKKIIIKSVPFIVHFDLVNACVLNCPLCPIGRKEGGMSMGTISFERFKEIFDQFKDYLFFIRLYNWGEPLLAKNLFKIVEYCHQNNVGVQIHSNLNYYTDEILENIVKYKIDYLHLSIDGFTQEAYEFYRKGGDIEKVLQGLERIIEYKKELKIKQPIIHWGYLVNNKNKDEVEEAANYAKKIGVDIFESYPISLFTTIDDRYTDENYLKFASDIKTQSSCKPTTPEGNCRFLWIGVHITPVGYYVPCAITYKDSDMFGMFDGKKDIHEVFNSKVFTESRKLSKFKGYKPECPTPCDRCYWHIKQ